MQKSKKGFTLIEVICGLVVMGIAVAAGFAVFLVGATGYARSARLSQRASSVQSFYTSGVQDAGVVKETKPEDITIKFGTKTAKFDNKVFVKSVSTDKDVSVAFWIWEDSIHD